MAHGAERDERPLVVTEKIKGALRITAVDPRALKLGLEPGLTLADASTCCGKRIFSHRNRFSTVITAAAQTVTQSYRYRGRPATNSSDRPGACFPTLPRVEGGFAVAFGPADPRLWGIV